MSDLTEDELVEIKKIFAKYDVDDNDTIDWEEFCNMVDELDIEVSLKDRTIVFDKVDTNHSGMINFEEFVECWKNKG
ncbi:MAG: EF-hand domain-containing protein [Proteobacteria bacterium]|nr:EF-hand domain-containing protein [Pseudomonadota bacterium]NOG61177.1 EF-hand domain-containing protein [Pseudomonadota bacterium]